MHDPVMVDEVLASLAIPSGAFMVDGTLGLAGHSLAMLRAAGPGGRLVGFDWDEEMLALAEVRLRAEGFDPVREDLTARVCLIHADYRAIPDRLGDLRPIAILLDLGLSSVHLDDPSRGIAFSTEGPLDMRMDRSRGEPAAALLNRASATEIERILLEFGDERWARRIGQVIVDRRRERPLRTTQDLVDCVMAAVPPAKRDRRLHPATRTFQAVRIAVNRELAGLKDALVAIARCLAPSGRMVVLSYHSGEDRAAKQAFRELEASGFVDLNKKPLTPSEQEIGANPRSRSAKLRAVWRQEATAA
jgi:16S rRNA (cytosine1402-N4)-methyltransferase